MKNFLLYVQEDRCSDFTFYRIVNLKNQNSYSVKIEVIQGRLGFNQHPDVLPPISHESTDRTDRKHLNGTISMARNEPCSTSSEIFICINDQPELNYNGSPNADGLGFGMFGMVKFGLDIVRRMQQSLSNDLIINKPIKLNG